jgi:hypothetical protein
MDHQEVGWVTGLILLGMWTGGGLM